MISNPFENGKQVRPQLSVRGEQIRNAVSFITAAKNRFKEGGAVEDVLDILNQARTLGAELMTEDMNTGSNIIFRTQALELAFQAKKNGATKEKLDNIFEMFKLNPEEI